MNRLEELKIVIKNHKWSLEELVYSELMSDWNRWYSSSSTVTALLEEKEFDKAEATFLELRKSAKEMILFLRNRGISDSETLKVLSSFIVSFVPKKRKGVEVPNTRRRKTYLIGRTITTPITKSSD